MEKKLQRVANVSQTNAETDSKNLKLLWCSEIHRDKRRKPPRRSNCYPKEHAVLRFLKQETKGSKAENKG